MFWKQTTVTLGLRLKREKVLTKLVDLFFQLQDYNSHMKTADGNTLKQNLNVWMLSYETWMATENCYCKKLVKAKSITSKQVPSLGTFSVKIRTASVFLYWTL